MTGPLEGAIAWFAATGAAGVLLYAASGALAAGRPGRALAGLARDRLALEAGLLSGLAGLGGWLAGLGLASRAGGGEPAGLAGGLLLLVGLYTVLGVAVFTLLLNRAYRGIVEPGRHAEYARATTGLLLAAAAGLGSAVFQVFSRWPGSGAGLAGAAGLLAGALLVLRSGLPVLGAAGARRGVGGHGLVETLGLATGVSGLLIAGVAGLVAAGLLADYTGVYVGAIGAAVLLMYPLAMYYQGHLSREGLRSIGLEAFHGGESAVRRLEEGLRSVTLGVVAAAVAGGVVAGLAAALARGDPLGAALSASGIALAGASSYRLIERVARGGLSGRILPLAVWAAREGLRECSERLSRGPVARGVLLGSVEALCGSAPWSIYCRGGEG